MASTDRTIRKTENSKGGNIAMKLVPASPKGSRNYVEFEKAMKQIQDAVRNTEMFNY